MLATLHTSYRISVKIELVFTHAVVSMLSIVPLRSGPFGDGKCWEMGGRATVSYKPSRQPSRVQTI